MISLFSNFYTIMINNKIVHNIGHIVCIVAVCVRTLTRTHDCLDHAQLYAPHFSLCFVHSGKQMRYI